MKLPADTCNWHEGHLVRVEAALIRQFDLYERYSGTNNLKADEHYSEYLNLCEQATNIRNVLGLKQVNYP